MKGLGEEKGDSALFTERGYINGLNTSSRDKNNFPKVRRRIVRRGTGKRKMFFTMAVVFAMLASSAIVFISASSSPPGNSFVLGQPAPYMKSYDPNLINNAKFLGYANKSMEITIIISFKWKNEDNLREFLGDVNDVKSPNYHRFLTWEEFRSTYSPDEDMYNATLQWLKANGLHIQHTWPLRNAISIHDTVGNIERAFNTKIGMYQGDGVNTRSVFYATMEPMKLPSNIIPYVLTIEGTNNSRMFKTMLASQRYVGNYDTRFYESSSGVRYVTTGDMQKMYHVLQLINNSADPTTPTSSPIFAHNLRAVTILWEGHDSSGNEVAPFDPAHIYYAWQHTIPTWQQNAGGMSHVWGHGVESDCVPPGSGVGSDTTGAYVENELDLEMIGGLAPGIDVVLVYSDSSQNGFPKDNYDYVLNTLVHNSTVTVVSNSWGYTGSEGSMDSGTMADVEALEALGVTVMASSGDDGDASYPSAPSSATYNNYGFMAVGGTTPVPNGQTGATGDEALMGNNTDATNPRSDEYLWYDSSSTISGSTDHWGTQSGTSSNYPYPWWQNQYGHVGSTSGRDTADVAAAGNRTLIYTTGSSGDGWYVLSGTSVACPVVGGIFSEMAAYVGRAYDGMGTSTSQNTIYGFGFFLPTIYHLADDYYNNNMYQSSPPFFDVTENDPTGGYGSHPAGQGWDYPTGWGVPNAWEFIHDIGFSITSDKSSATVVAGSSAQYTLYISFPYNWTSEVGHVVVDGLPSGAGYSTNPTYVHPSGNGASSTITLTVTTSTSTPAGNYTLTVYAYTYNHTSGHWGNLSNSVQVTLEVTPSNAPDLTITSISTSAATVNEGDTVTIYATVKNVGDEDASNVYVGFYYDSVSSSTHIGNVSVGTLAAGSSANVQITWDTTGHTGTHALIAYADPDNIISEKNETNNSATTTVTVNGYGVSLSVTPTSATVQPGGTATYTITVTNTGTLQDTYDLSTSSVATGWSASLSQNQVTLNAGDSTTVTLSVTSPSDATNGDSQDVTVTAVSQGDSSKSDSVTTTTTVTLFSITSIKIYSHLAAVINYTTSESLKTYIEYGIGPNHMNMQTPEESTASTYHEVAIENLTPMITYYFRIHMSDGTNSAWSQVYNFTLTGFNDFETTDNGKYLYDWHVSAWDSSNNQAEPSLWQWGQPSAGPSGAYSGSDVVATNLSGYYGVDNHVDVLLTPWIDLTNASWVTLSFYAWYDLENGYDGLLIAYENDSSSTWWILDANNNASQYDGQISTSYGSAIGGHYAFTGSTNAWVQKVFNTTTINDNKVNSYLLGHKVRFIFYFASDSSVNNHYGFYLDDIQVKAGIPLYHIYGYVNDSSGNPISGATVWVNDTDLGTSYKVTTDSSGRYDVYTYNGMSGDSINVDAQNGAEKGSNTGTLSSTSVEIDVTLSAVPEFSWYLAIFLFAAFAIISRRRKMQS